MVEEVYSDKTKPGTEFRFMHIVHEIIFEKSQIIDNHSNEDLQN